MNVIAPTASTSVPQPPAGATPARRSAELLTALLAVVRKDVRANVIYAVAILGLLGLLTMLPRAIDAIYYPNARREIENINILVTEWYRSTTPMVTALIGLLLGVLARLPRESAQWAYLMHRPISRGWMFVGRVLAGLILYGIAAGVPAAFVLIYARFSWGIPYHWHMMLPTMVDVCCGFVYYIAGMLAADRRAFIVWRVLPVIPAIICSVLVVIVPWFSAAMGIVLVLGCVLGLAALGAQLSDGYSLRVPAYARVPMLVVLFAGLSALVGLAGQSVVGIAGAIADDQWSAHDLPRIVRLKSRTEFQFLPDGTVGRRRLLFTATAPANDNGTESRNRIYLPADSETPVNPQPTLDRLKDFSRQMGILWHERQRPDYRFFDISYNVDNDSAKTRSLDESGKPILTAKGTPDSDVWFGIPAAGIFLGYRESTHQYVGSIGVNGFAPPGQSPEPFSQAYWPGEAFGPKGIYGVNIKDRSVKLVTPLPSGAKVTAGTWLTPNPSSAKRLYYHVVAIEDRLLLFKSDRSGMEELVTTIMLDEGDWRYMQLVCYTTPQGDVEKWGLSYGEASSSDWITSNDTVPYLIKPTAFDFFDPQGKRISHMPVPPGPVIDPVPATLSEPATAALIRHEYHVACGITDALADLPLVWLMKAVSGRWNGYYDYTAALRMDFTNDPHDAYYAAAAVFTLAVCAVVAFFVTRRYHVRFGIVWVVATVVFGPTVLLLLVLTHTLPRREPCPKCGRLRFAAEATCGHCGAEFMPPPADPAAIFAATPGGAT